MNNMLKTLPIALLSCLLATACIVDVEDDVDDTWEKSEPDYDAEQAPEDDDLDVDSVPTAESAHLPPAPLPTARRAKNQAAQLNLFKYECYWSSCAPTSYCGTTADATLCPAPSSPTCTLRNKPTLVGPC